MVGFPPVVRLLPQCFSQGKSCFVSSYSDHHSVQEDEEDEGKNGAREESEGVFPL